MNDKVIDRVRMGFWGEQIENVMTEMWREAAICDVKLLDPGVLEAVLNKNASVCGSANPIAFRKLRELLLVGLVVREKAFDKLGAIEAEALIREIREHLRAKFEGRPGAV